MEKNIHYIVLGIKKSITDPIFLNNIIKIGIYKDTKLTILNNSEKKKQLIVKINNRIVSMPSHFLDNINLRRL